MECKVDGLGGETLGKVSIDLTRMECKVFIYRKFQDFRLCIDLTRMECKEAFIQLCYFFLTV